jgi:hypothetical protein
MSFWNKRDRKLDDFAEGIRPELSSIRTDAPPDALFDRIRASRAEGARVILPTESAPPHRSGFWYASTAIAAVLATFLVIRDSSAPDSGDPIISSPNWFASVAHAQSPPTGVPAIRVTLADRFRPVSVRYARIERDPSGAERTGSTINVSATATESGGVPAWLIVADDRELNGGRALVDSIIVDQSTLTMMSHATHASPYQRYSQINVSQRFNGLRLSGEMTAELNGRVDVRRTFSRALDADAAPFVADAFGPLYLMGVALHEGWRARVSATGWAVRDDDVLYSRVLVVEGSDRVRVPAGEFECWRLRVEAAGSQHTYWVRKSDGLGIKTAAPAARREIVLVKE